MNGLWKKILKHRIDRNEKFKFLTRWQGTDPDSDTWEPVDNFIHWYSSDLVQYCLKHNLPINIMEYLSPTPTQLALIQCFNRRSSPKSAWDCTPRIFLRCPDLRSAAGDHC